MARIPRNITAHVASRQLKVSNKFKQNLMQSLLEEDNHMANKRMNLLDILRQQKKFLPVGAVVAAALIVGGTYAMVNNRNEQLAHEQSTQLPTDLSNIVPIEQIRTTALQDVPTGSVIGVEVEVEDGVLVYKVRFADGTVRVYDARTGTPIIEQVSDDSVNDDQNEDAQDENEQEDETDDIDDDQQDDETSGDNDQDNSGSDDDQINN